ncbi:permease-like cell division protein FtsX [Clostridium sp. Cult3]|uniref:permease-like cell division protein FtsX n=1 Tax=Clostridium sp. Cult3 TaxID=2079004 RepID=UPI001F01C31B|nr:permease-like cell division protein FtsX [Clostridium sp. Cult3]MCF6460430.1 ABC transporter permease [Clostridium sp. Cult3]
MNMKFRIFKNIVKQGFQGMWRNRGMGLASVGSITAVLIILGIVLIMILSINNVVLETKNKFDEIQIFLEDDITDEQLDHVENQAGGNEGVLSVIYQSKDQAMEIMKEDWEENASLLEGLETNPLPNSFIVKLKDIEYADSVVDKVSGLAGVEEVKYYKDIIEKLVLFANYVRGGGLIITAILIFVSIFIISNTIKITVTARQREVNIMKYVGATNGYIRGPFIIEGILFGLIGAVLSILIVNYGYGYFFNTVNDKLYVLFTVYLVPPVALIKDISIIFIAIGVGIGALGSLVSLKRFLNV